MAGNRRHKWTREENKELLHCYYAVNPDVRGFRARLFELWHERNPGDSGHTEQKLCGQVSSVLRRKVFSELELAKIRSSTSQMLHTVDSSEDSSLQNSTDGNVPSLLPGIDTNDLLESEQESSRPLEENVEQDCILPLDDHLNLLKEEILKRYESLYGKPKQQLPSLKAVPQKKLTKLISDANKVLSSIPTNSLYDLHHLMYCSASIIIEHIGYTPKSTSGNNPPQWKIRLLSKIKSLQAELSRLHSLKQNNLLCSRKLLELHRRYSLHNAVDINAACEYVLQKIRAYSCRLKRYEDKNKFTKKNQMFKHHKHEFFNMLSDSTKYDTNLSPPLNDTLKFWKELWGNPCEHDVSMLPHIREALGQVSPMTTPQISTELFSYAVSRIKNWKAPGPDCLHGFWIKRFTVMHKQLMNFYYDILSGDAADPWLLQGHTTLIIKNKSHGPIPSNFRPITCLSTMWKLFSFILSELIYKHFDDNCLLPVEQKGCRKGSRGTKDHLLVDKLIMDIARHKHRNLHMSWIDYRKAYDSVPHSWLLECFSLYSVHPLIYQLLSKVMKLWKVQLFSSNTYYGEVDIQRGIFQGDSLSPLLFIMALMPLSTILNTTGKGFCLNKEGLVLNHLLYLDDLKLFAKTRADLESLLSTVKLFSSSIHMNFGIDKCATTSIVKGKLTSCEDIAVSADTIIPSLNTYDSYKYLGVFENDKFKEGLVKEIIVSSYKKRIKKLLKSSLNGCNLISAINLWAIPLVRYTAGLIKWTQTEIRTLDVSTRKLLTLYKCFGMKDDVDRLYVPRKKGGRGLLSVEDVLHYEKLSLAQYLANNDEPLLQAVYQESQWRGLEELPATFKNRRSNEHLEAWRDKPLHGQFIRELDDGIDLQQQWSWLCNSNLKKETEGLVMAAQDQAISINYIKANIFHQGCSCQCRLCGSNNETVDHILSSCSVIAQSYYKQRHDEVAKIIHWELCKQGGFSVSDQWWTHKPYPVMENTSMKLLWDFTIQCDRQIPHNRPDIVCVDYLTSKSYLIDVAIPGDSRIKEKVSEKHQRYTDLKIEIQKMWNIPVVILPVILGTLGSISLCLGKHLKTLNIYYNGLIPKLQKSVVLSSCHIIRRFLTEYHH